MRQRITTCLIAMFLVFGLTSCSYSDYQLHVAVEDFLKLWLKEKGFKKLECIGNSPTFKIINKPHFSKSNGEQKIVVPAKAQITFKAIINNKANSYDEGEERIVVGTLNIKAVRGDYYFFGWHHYLRFFVSVNQWSILQYYENAPDYYCK